MRRFGQFHLDFKGNRSRCRRYTLPPGSRCRRYTLFCKSLITNCPLQKRKKILQVPNVFNKLVTNLYTISRPTKTRVV